MLTAPEPFHLQHTAGFFTGAQEQSMAFNTKSPGVRGGTTTWRVAGISMGLLMTGCAINPLVDWKAPDDQINSGPMEDARAYANTYKQALNRKAREYVGAQVQLNNELLGLGLLTVGGLVGRANRDVPLVFSGLFGSTYLYGQQNLGKTRLDVYQSGISATNCAVAAVSPLDFSPKELDAIALQGAKLGGSDIADLAYWLSQSRWLFATAGTYSDEQKKIVNHQLDGAAATYQAGLDLLNDSSQLPGRVNSAAAGLKATVDVIAAETDKLASSTIVDPATVAKSIGGLASIVGSVAPGAGLDATYTSRITPTPQVAASAPTTYGRTAKAEIKSRGLPGSDPKLDVSPTISTGIDLSGALANLAKAQAIVDATVKAVGGRIATSKLFGDGASAALKQCGVSDVAVGLTVDATTITITGGPSLATVKELGVTGGVKPYVGRIVEPVPANVQLRVPAPGDSVFVLTVPQGLATGNERSFQIKIQDSASHSALVRVTVTKGVVE
jgi:hypothetical protein